MTNLINIQNITNNNTIKVGRSEQKTKEMYQIADVKYWTTTQFEFSGKVQEIKRDIFNLESFR